MSESDRPSTAATDSRLIQDDLGNTWVVREVEQFAYDRRSRSLVFMTDGVMRRVRNYPPDWRNWSDEDLLAVSKRS